MQDHAEICNLRAVSLLQRHSFQNKAGAFLSAKTSLAPGVLQAGG